MEAVWAQDAWSVSYYLQTGYYREGQAAEIAEGRDTHLTTWFWLNSEDPNLRQFLYSDIPKQYKPII